MHRHAPLRAWRQGRGPLWSAVLDGDVKLPEGSVVLVEPVESSATLEDLLGSVAGKGSDLPSDGSTQHDHYIFGIPKR